jgi:prepilin-type N-terminal cleavage/methylation domain-containing protein/prepilin-type processing-associated H-X9-DG protein
MPMRKLFKRRGFTLIELLVVIAIIAILASMLLPALGRAKHTAKKIQCGGGLKNYGMAMGMYTNDNAGFLPASDRASPPSGEYWIIALSEYIDPNMPDSTRYSISSIGKVLLPCPSMEEGGLFSYAYNNYLNSTGSGSVRAWKKIENINNVSSLPALIDHSNRTVWNATASSFDPSAGSAPIKYRHLNGANMLFVDGHIDWATQDVIRNEYPAKFFPDNN